MPDEKGTPQPRRKTPMRSKTTDGSASRPTLNKTAAGSSRRMPPLRSKSFDESTPVMQRSKSKRFGRESSDRNGMQKSHSQKSIGSMRNLMRHANSVKNVVVAAPEQAVKVHKFLNTKTKTRPGQMPVSALSSRNVMGEQKKQRSRLTRAMSGLSVDSSNGSNHRRATSRGRDSKSPQTRGEAKRGSRKPNRSLTPSNSRRKKERPRVEEDDPDAICIM